MSLVSSHTSNLPAQNFFPWRWFFVLSLAAACATVWFGPICIAALVVLFLGYSVYIKPEIGLYIMVALTPMIGLNIESEALASWLGLGKTSVQLYAPLVDIWTIFFLVIFVVRTVVHVFQSRSEKILLPGVWWYFGFLISAYVSLLHLPQDLFSDGVKYLIRFPLFAYVGYMVLGVNVMRRKEVVLRALQVFFFVGVGAAILGCMSLLVNAYQIMGLTRAVPIPVFGIDLFNFANDIRFGHILLAEFLTLVFPIGLYLIYRANTQRHRFWYGVASVFVCCVCVLTFSRAGWLTLVFQALLGVALFYRQIPWQRVRQWVPAAIFLMAVPVWYMSLFLQSSIVSSSNSARFALTEIGWHLFLDRPLFGQGVGMYTVLLEDVFYFTSQFGDPIEAHSIFTKISSEQGLFGLITFGIFVLWIVSRIFVRLRDDSFSTDARVAAVISLFLVATPLFFQLFNTQYYSARMWVPLLLAIGLSVVHERDVRLFGVRISFVEKKSRVDTNF